MLLYGVNLNVKIEGRYFFGLNGESFLSYFVVVGCEIIGSDV